MPKKAAAKPEPKAAKAKKAVKAAVVTKAVEKPAPKPRAPRKPKAKAPELTPSVELQTMIDELLMTEMEITPEDIAETAANAAAEMQGDIHTIEHQEFQAKAAEAAADPNWEPERNAEHARIRAGHR